MALAEQLARKTPGQYGTGRDISVLMDGYPEALGDAAAEANSMYIHHKDKLGDATAMADSICVCVCVCIGKHQMYITMLQMQN